MSSNVKMPRFLLLLMIAVWAMIVPEGTFAASVMAPGGGIPTFYRADFQQPIKTQGRIRTADGDTWTCGSNRCETHSLRRGFGVNACRALVHTQGQVTTFTGYDSGHRRALRLTPTQIRQCNSSGQRAAPVVVHVGRSAPDTVRAGPLILVGKPQVLDTVRTGQLVLVGKAKPRIAQKKIGKQPKLPIGRGP